MSRSGYSDDCENVWLWRGAVQRAINGKRGQAFLKELAATMDAMPEKRLIKSELISETGEMCTIGTVCRARGLNIENIDIYNSEEVGRLVNISRAMAAEIEFENDECGHSLETPEQRWARMRKWVDDSLVQS